MASLHIIYASTSGHTEHVVDTLIALLAAKGVKIAKQRAEESAPEDLLKGDVLLLASGTWNTGGIEGQLNPHMHDFLKIRAKDIDLKEKSVAVIALGDARYRYTAKADEHLKEFVEKHHGKILGEPLKIVNEPFGQEEAVRAWGGSFLPFLT